jgi:hypothetical protein
MPDPRPATRARVLAALFSVFSLVHAAQAAAPEGFVSPLATRDQAEAERLALRILADPGVRAARERALERMQADPIAKTAEGRARLERALDAWLTYLTVQEVNADPARPKVVWSCDLSEYTWFGHTFPASGAAIDNPDNLYRHIPLDGESRYEIRGRLRPMHPAQFSYQLIRHTDIVPRGTDLESLGVLNSRDLEIGADGSFVVHVDPEPADGRRNHIRSPPGPLLRLILRDTLTDWKQNATELEVRRISGPQPPPAPSEQQLAARVAAQFPDFVPAWLNFIRVFNGDPPANQLVPPYGRTGGWRAVRRRGNPPYLRRRGAYRSVMVPSASSADSPSDSERVGCGWIVSARSSASAPISIASAISAMSSPALRPAIPAPSTRCVPGSSSSLVRPSGRPMPSARPLADQGNTAFSNSTPSCLARSSFRPVQAISGSV